MISALCLDQDWPVVWFDEIDSTNTEAHRRASSGERGPVSLVGRVQTAGKGRLGRQWLSGSGNLYSTALVPLDGMSADVPCMALSVALAVRDAVVDLSNRLVIPGLKWPNDVRIDGAKLCGILLESGLTPSRDYWLAIGVGINLAHAPSVDNYETISLVDAGGGLKTPEEAIAVLNQTLKKRLKQQLHAGRSSIIRDWMDATDQKGKRCAAQHGSERVQGLYHGLDEFGQLQIKQDDGKIITITAGDVDMVKGR